MVKFIDKLVHKSEISLNRSGIDESNGIVYLREKVFLVSLQIVLVLALVPLVICLNFAIKEKLWLVVFIESFGYISVCAIIFTHIFSVKIKIIYVLIINYLLGISLLFFMGSNGPGIIILVCFSLVASIFLGFKPAMLTILINIITVFAFGIGIKFKLFETPFFLNNTITSWSLVGINLIVVTLILVYTLNYLIGELEKSLNREHELKEKLKKKSERLISAKIKAEESDQLKSAFLANVSHEFRTPMNAIIGFTEIMLYTNPSREKRIRYLENIQASSEQLIQIIHNTIEYSKIEMGTIDLDPVKVDIIEILNTIYEQLKSKSPKNLDFICVNPNEDEKKLITTDREKLNQVFSNLITNAFKFTSVGEVKFGWMESAHDDFYQFFVKDTGIGIRKEKQKDIFTRFHKEDDFKQGTGLGLSISATLIMHMGGRMWLESKSGVGTTFYFILPKNLVVRDL